MGFGLLLSRLGFGAPRLIADAMCRQYLAIRGRAPELPEREVLREVYESRVRTAISGNRAARFGYSLEPTRVDEVVRDRGASLAALVEYVVLQECPALLEHHGRLISVLETLSTTVSARVRGRAA